jgi:gluconate 2-dehydrogenase subunit 3-like protein
MRRRSVLKALTALPAATLLRGQQPVIPPKPTPAAVEEIPIIDATVPDFAGTTVPSFFSDAQLAALRRLSDLIVPAINNVPGALAVGVPEFLDSLIGQSPRARQTEYCQGLDELNSRAQRQFHHAFANTSEAEADEILGRLRAQWTASPDQFVAFLRTAKQDILQATQSSEDWIRIMSKRVRSAGGLGTYWFPIE